MDLTAILSQPVPDFQLAREHKHHYREYPILSEGVHADEPLVDISLYGLAGQSYYSRPNAATGEPVPGIEPAVYLRQSIVERLVEVNRTLQQSPEVAALFGGEVELYVQEGFRPTALQRKLYDKVFPELIRQQYPHWTSKQVAARRDELIAKPHTHHSSPSPHATGAAVDLTLRYAEPNLGYVPGRLVKMGRKATDMSETTNPDYYERPVSTAVAGRAQKHRRAFYWIMRGAVLGEDTGFVVNPTEWWHWSYGDQLWAKLTDAPAAFFGEAKID